MTGHESAVKDVGNRTPQKDAMARRATNCIDQYCFLMINPNLPAKGRCPCYRADPQLVQRGLWHQPVMNLRAGKMDRLGDTDFKGYLESSFLLFSLPPSTAVYGNTYLNFRYYVLHHP
jgi:hypothetical protein